MNGNQINLIRQSFQKIAPRAEAVADGFYQNLFSLQPALRLLFPENLAEQKKKLMQMLGAAVALLDKPEKLAPVLADLGRRHARYGVSDEHYDTVGATLLQTLREMLGAEFSAETESAWAEMYAVVSETMKKAAHELSVAPDKIQETPASQKTMKILSPATQIASFLLIFLMFAAPVWAQTSTFTYQGKLNDNAVAANGSYQFEFKLYDAPGAGNQIGTTLTDVPATILNGIFTVQLDFGAGAFDGTDRFLEISVRRNSSESYVALNPRQPLTSAPYAIRSKTADTAMTANNSTQLGGVNANEYVQTTDSRMSDARDPLPGSGNYVQNSTTVQPASNFNISGEGKAGTFSAATEYKIGADRVLSNQGTGNVFLGVNAGSAVNAGAYNTIIGFESGLSNTTGTSNLIVGAYAGRANTSGNFNTFVGTDAGRLNTTGTHNSFFGKSSGLSNTTGNENTFAGFASGNKNTTGEFNSFFGSSAGVNNTTGNYNSFYGYESGLNATTADANAFFGFQTGRATTTGKWNAFYGAQAGFANTTGEQNSFFGSFSGLSNTTGSFNSFFGLDAGRKNATGVSNAFFGILAGRENTSGGYNSFYGSEAGRNNNGSANSFFGSAAGVTNTTGINNAFFGSDAGRLNQTGEGNAFLGTFAGYNNATGNANTFVGVGAGQANATGSNNTLLGNGANLGANNLTNAAAIGAGAIVAQSNSLVLGNNANVGIGTSTPASKLTVAGVIETTAGGIKFPDGTVQSSAFSGNFIVNSSSAQPFSNFNITGIGRAGMFTANSQYNLGDNRILGALGANNLFVGIDAGAANTTGERNAFFGSGAGNLNTTGSDNAFFGALAGNKNTTGVDNTFFGARAGTNTVDGDQNAFYGTGAGRDNINGDTNAFFGAQAGLQNTSGRNNTYLGFSAGNNNLTGTSNVAVGRQAGQFNETGSSNVYIGGGTGFDDDGSNNTLVGAQANTSGSSVLTFATAIGSGATVSTSNTIVLGRSSGADKIRVPGLGAAGATPLCRNANNEISICSNPLAGDDVVKQEIFKTLKTQQEQIEAQARQIELLKKLVCTQNPEAEVCR